MRKRVKSFASLALVCFLGACAPGLDGARQALTDAEQVETQAMKAIEAYDESAKAKILDDLDQTHDLDAAKKAFAEYQKRNAILRKAVQDAAAVTGLGGPLLALVESGVKKSKDLTTWLSQLFDAMQALATAMKSLGVALPGGV